MKAIVLAGGKGTRLQSAVSDLPKPMAFVGKKHFLEIILKQLQDNEVKNVIFSVGHKKEMIIDFFQERYGDISINYCIETSPLGTGGAIKKAILEDCESTYFIVNGDTFFNIDFRTLLEEHIKRKNDITIATKLMYNSDRYGSVVVDENNRIKLFKEKGFYKESIINAGIYVINREVIVNYANKSVFSLEKELFEKRVRDLKIGNCTFDSYFIDIGIPEDYYKAQKELVNLIE